MCVWFAPKMSSEVAKIEVCQKLKDLNIRCFEYLKDIGQIPQPVNSEYEMGSKLDKGTLFYLVFKPLEILSMSCIR